MVIKKWSGSAWDAQVVQTTLRGIKTGTSGLGSTTESDFAFTSSGKLKEEHFPDYIFGGLKFKAATAVPSSSSFATTLISLISTAENEGGDPSSLVGSYYIATGSGTWPIFSGTNGGSGYVYVKTEAESPVEEAQSSTMTVEAGDWVVISRFTGGSGQSALDPYVFKLAIVNNTYQDAGTGAKGIVQLSSESTYANLSGDNVITAGVLKTVIDDAGFITSSEDQDTTYSLSVDSGTSSTTIIRLSDGTNSDDVTITAGSNITISNESGTGFTISSTDTNTTYSQATDSTLGLIKVSSTENSRTTQTVTDTSNRQYAVQVDTNGVASVNVPWVNSDTRRILEVNGTQRLSGSSLTALDLQATTNKGITLSGSNGDVEMELTYKVYHGDTLPTLTNDTAYSNAIGFEW